MTSLRLFLICNLCSGILMMAPGSVTAQEDPEELADSSVASIGFRAGYGWPIGDWAAHRFAPVDQFRPGFTGGGDIEFRLSHKVGLGITVDYTQLNTGDWENYAASRGSNVSAKASVVTTGLMIRPYLRKKAPSFVKMEIGLILSFASGKERGDRNSYEYDFMKSPAFGILIGAEYEYLLSESVSFTIRSNFSLALSGVEYADGTEFALTLVPLTGGFRFRL